VSSSSNRRLLILCAGEAQLIAGGANTGYCDATTGSNARFNDPRGVLCLSDGERILVADLGNDRILLIHIASGEVSTIAGDGQEMNTDGKGTAASIDGPRFMVFDVRDRSVVYITSNNALRRLNLRTRTCRYFFNPPLFFLFFSFLPLYSADRTVRA
jgi:hypothetical protein